MIYESDRMKLLTVSTRTIGEVSDCYICRDLNSPGGIMYTVIVVHEHEVVRHVLEMFKMSDRTGAGVLVDNFADGENQVLVFPYHRERPLKDFYSGDALTLAQCEEICTNAILACITSDLPYPILYLLLNGGQLNLSSDRSVFFSYEMDLADMDPEIGESECTDVCARILLDILEPKSSQKATSYYLLSKKTANGSYDRFTDLYRDITIAATSSDKVSIFKRIRIWFRRYTDNIIGALFWLSIIFGLIALSLLVSRVFLGGNSWFRLLFNTFKTIGTESLLQ